MRVGALLLALLAARAQASSWWLTPDQEAQRALESGDAARAAQLFSDPQRRAYAEIEAKQYAEAARRLAPFQDPESQYNRGNALAHAGDLSAALSSYDAALKRATPDSPLQRDAKHNRDLVARQLEQQKHAQGQSKSGGPQGQGQQQQGQQQQQQSQQQQQQSQQQQQQGQQGQNQQAQQGTSQSKDGDRDRAEHEAQGQGDRQSAQQAQGSSQEGQKRTQQGQDGTAQPAPQGGRSSAAAQNQQTEAPDSADQARHDVEAGLRASNSDRGNPLDRSAPRSAAPSEQTLSRDQWLRQIPDDPAGLLRRKFLIEHMMKQGVQP